LRYKRILKIISYYKNMKQFLLDSFSYGKILRFISRSHTQYESYVYGKLNFQSAQTLWSFKELEDVEIF